MATEKMSFARMILSLMCATLLIVITLSFEAEVAAKEPVCSSTCSGVGCNMGEEQCFYVWCCESAPCSEEDSTEVWCSGEV